ncbi:DUF4433 domain-containing protein [Aureispira anguillae]|uniref:DUF4433 domain-containing protein n=1 Tax=Aureispira anguillae TaxID=2864201 RepID=A0A915Y9X0_9BACT|nr:DUF4433 domain-containing protein [Aureispira anguillae]
MNNSIHFLEYYNDNDYLKLCNYLKTQLISVRRFLLFINSDTGISPEVSINKLYKKIFSHELTQKHISFEIKRIHNSSIALSKVNRIPKDYLNSNLHLTIKFSNSEILELDELYNNMLYKVIRFYKYLYSSIHKYLSNKLINLLPPTNKPDPKLDKYTNKIKEINQEIHQFIESNGDRFILSERDKLPEVYRAKLPFNGLFHMTSYKNLSSILKLGLLSHKKAHNNNHITEDISNQEVNLKRNRYVKSIDRNIHDLVPLYINPQNPMLKSLKNKEVWDDLVFLRVNPDIIIDDTAFFSNGNAAWDGAKFFSSTKDLKKLNWRVLRQPVLIDTDKIKKYRCSEVLVDEKIPMYYVDEIYLKDEKLLQKVIELFPNHLGIKIALNPEIFVIPN